MYSIFFGGRIIPVWYSLIWVFNFILANILLGVELIGFWFTYKKMNIPGWKGIIPFYNVYALFEELWETKRFWRMVIFCGISAVSYIIGEVFLATGDGLSSRDFREAEYFSTNLVFLITGIVFLIIALVMLVLAFVICFKLYHKTTVAFGLKKAWVWGLIFVPYIMFPIIGFNKNIVYYGPIEHLEPVDQE